MDTEDTPEAIVLIAHLPDALRHFGGCYHPAGPEALGRMQQYAKVVLVRADSGPRGEGEPAPRDP